VAVIDPLAQHDADRPREIVLDPKAGTLIYDDIYGFLRIESLGQLFGTAGYVHKTIGINSHNLSFMLKIRIVSDPIPLDYLREFLIQQIRFIVDDE